MLNSDRHDTYPKVESATLDYAEQLRHKSNPVGVGEIAYSADEEYDGEWEDIQAVGQAKGKGKGYGRGESKDAKGPGRTAAKASLGKRTRHTSRIDATSASRRDANTAQCDKEKAKARGKNGVYGVDDGTAAKTTPKP